MPQQTVEPPQTTGTAVPIPKVRRSALRRDLPLSLTILAVLLAGLTFFASLLWLPLLIAGGAGAAALAGEYLKLWQAPKWTLQATLAIGTAILTSLLLSSIGHILALACFVAAVVLFIARSTKR